MESFFGTLKSEFFHLNKFANIEQLQRGLPSYIHYYNHQHIKLKTKRPESGAVPDSGFQSLAFNCPTAWGQFTKPRGALLRLGW